MQTFLVTGANRGIGLELARQALAAGQRVHATCRDPARAEELSRLEGPLEVHALDVTDEAATSALAERLDGQALDVLLNNAGLMGERQSPDDMDYRSWMDAFAVNAIAPWRMAVSFAAHLHASSRPRVVTLTSQMGSLTRAGGDRVAYRSSKAAANMAMRTLAEAWRERGITVCALHPGWVRTDMGGSAAALGVAESATGLLRVIEGLSIEDSGRFLDQEGDELPW